VVVDYQVWRTAAATRQLLGMLDSDAQPIMAPNGIQISVAVTLMGTGVPAQPSSTVNFTGGATQRSSAARTVSPRISSTSEDTPELLSACTPHRGSKRFGNTPRLRFYVVTSCRKEARLKGLHFCDWRSLEEKLPTGRQAAAQAHWAACRSAQKPNIPMPDHRLDTAPDRRLNTAGSAA